MTLPAIKEQALGLPAPERMWLAANLLESLPAARECSDDGVAEALRRERELPEDSAAGISWQELKAGLGR